MPSWMAEHQFGDTQFPLLLVPIFWTVYRIALYGWALYGVSLLLRMVTLERIEALLGRKPTLRHRRLP